VSEAQDSNPSDPASAAEHLLRCLRFYSRLPVPAFAFERAPYAMLDFRRGARWLPLNKSLWTPTFALTSAGVAAVVFALCSLVVDLLEWRAWSAPFLWLGVNPLAIYFLSELSRHLLDLGWVPHESGRLGAKDAFFWRYLSPWLAGLSPARASLVFAVGFTALWIGVAGVLYRRGVRVRI
jgi:predicted acyltransferase